MHGDLADLRISTQQRDLAGVDESLPLTTRCPSPYPVTKATAEREALAASDDQLRVTALRPHLIWGVGDPHLVPRVLARARAGRLRIVGPGTNRVDISAVHDPRTGNFILTSAEDNLVKGASGQAVQIMNLWCGFPETAGLA